MTLARSFVPLVDLVFPPRCPSCGEGIADQNGLCASCWQDLVIPGEPACAACQRPLDARHASSGALCAVCLQERPEHDGIAAATLYNDTSRRLVLAFKHGRRIALARMLAGMMEARLPPCAGPTLIVPVPLHRWRLWRRGFNQSALLARAIAERRNGTRLVVDALVRCKPTPSLGGLGRKARARALSGAIAVNPRRAGAIRDADMVLVDDVMTTGATARSCVKALKRAGARSVRVTCFARVLEEAL